MGSLAVLVEGASSTVLAAGAVSSEVGSTVGAGVGSSTSTAGSSTSTTGSSASAEGVGCRKNEEKIPREPYVSCCPRTPVPYALVHSSTPLHALRPPQIDHNTPTRPADENCDRAVSPRSSLDSSPAVGTSELTSRSPWKNLRGAPRPFSARGALAAATLGAATTAGVFLTGAATGAGSDSSEMAVKKLMERWRGEGQAKGKGGERRTSSGQLE